PIYVGEKLIAYVLTNYCNPPQEMRINWITTYGETGGVYWGVAQPGDSQYQSMGPVPSPGTWVRLEVLANTHNLEERWLDTITLTATGGAVWWDAIGKAGAGCTLATASAPSIPAGDTILIDDCCPAGSAWGSDTDATTWTAQQHASGNQSVTVPFPEAPGYHNIHLTNLTPTPIYVGENMVTYVLLD